jgi:hypothetical protein
MATPVIDAQSLLLAQQYDGLVDYLLLDTYQPGETQVGATGAPHNWDLSRRIVSSVHTPVIFSERVCMSQPRQSWSCWVSCPARPRLTRGVDAPPSR